MRLTLIALITTLIVCSCSLTSCVSSSYQVKTQHKAVAAYLSVMDSKNELAEFAKDAKIGLFKPADGDGSWRIEVHVRKANDKWYWLRHHKGTSNGYVHMKRKPWGYVLVRNISFEELIDLSKPFKAYVEPDPEF